MPRPEPRPGRILALGGGGFTAGPQDAPLDDLVLDLAEAREPRICFLPTASGDPDHQVGRFYASFGHLACRPSHLSLFRLGDHPLSPAELLLSQDVIYVGGGSMRNLLAVWRAHDLHVLLPACWRRGIALAGLSAGAMCWFAGGVTRSTGRPEPIAGLGLLEGSLSVHRDSEADRRPAHLDAVAHGTLAPGWALDDGVGLLYDGTRLERVVSSRPDRVAVRVEREGDEAVETVVEPELLTARTPGAVARPVPDDVRELRALRYGPLRA